MKWLKLVWLLTHYTAARIGRAIRFRTSRICKKLQKRR